MPDSSLSSADSALVDRLVDAYSTHSQIGPDDWHVPADLQRAHRIQDAFAARLGRRRIGWKAAATNAPAQARRGVAEPLYGQLFADALFEQPIEIDAARFIDPHLEIEFAFRFGRAPVAAQPRFDAAEIADAIDSLALAVELVDSRCAEWRNCDAASLVADNLAPGATLLGPSFTDWRSLPRTDVVTTLHVDGQQIAAGSGAEVLGDPLQAVVWLADRLRSDGRAIEAGQWVLSGTTCPVVRLSRGATQMTAEFSGLGRLVAEFRW
ncbi:MAG: 2-keto-4-pentenoate hydratase [Burkholderiaceae bacterium]